jgi:putative transposase
MTSLWQSVRLSPIKPLWVSSLYLRSSLCVRANNYSPLRPASAHPSHGGSSSPDRKRRSIRLRRYDYTQTGAYFITMCTQNRRHRFGTIVAGTMVLNEAAASPMIAGGRCPTIFQISNWPNGWSCPIIFLGASRTIGAMVRGFKIGVTKWYRQQSAQSKIWQRDYWDHIVRNESELNRIRRYIANNPTKWAQDSQRVLPNDGDQIREPLFTYGREVWMI